MKTLRYLLKKIVTYWKRESLCMICDRPARKRDGFCSDACGAEAQNSLAW